MPNCRQITPFLHVPDLKKALEWFKLIGFAPRFQQSNYAYVEREGVGVRIVESTQEDGKPFEPHRGFAYYVDCNDVDAIVRECLPRLKAAGVKTIGPVDQAYNQREFIIEAPDGDMFVFGQAIVRR